MFFTSDNGLLLGEHRQVDRKANAFEEAILVPLIVRGPGVPAGQRVALPVLNIDLAPTFAELAGVTVPDTVDGRSLVPFLKGNPPDPAKWRTDFLVEHYSNGVSASVRNADVLYTDIESGERELYDMNKRPLPAREPPPEGRPERHREALRPRHDTPPVPRRDLPGVAFPYSIPRDRTRKAHTSAASSMILAVGLPAPWPARVSMRMSTGLSHRLGLPAARPRT